MDRGRGFMPSCWRRYAAWSAALGTEEVVISSISNGDDITSNGLMIRNPKSKLLARMGDVRLAARVAITCAVV